MQMISVIICSYNGAHRLPKTLSALRRSDLSSVKEVIVVDNASTDETSQIAERYLSTIPTQFYVIRENTPGLVFARAAGVKFSSGEIVTFIDDDNEIEPTWLTEVIKSFSYSASIGAVGGQTLPPHGQYPRWFDELGPSYAVGRQNEGSGLVTHGRMLLWGAGLSARRDLIEKFYSEPAALLLSGRVGKKMLAGDDTELCYHIVLSGYDLFYNEKLLLRHNIELSRITLKSLFVMHVGFGRARFRLFPYHVALKKGRIWRYDFFHNAAGIFLLAMFDHLLAILSTLFRPSIVKCCRIFETYGYLSETVYSKVPSIPKHLRITVGSKVD